MAIRQTSKVTRLYTNANGCYIQLDLTAVDPADRPKNDYFLLPLTHANYNSLYSLAIVAGVNRYDLHIRTVADIVPTQYAEVSYLVVDW